MSNRNMTTSTITLPFGRKIDVVHYMAHVSVIRIGLSGMWHVLVGRHLKK